MNCVYRKKRTFLGLAVVLLVLAPQLPVAAVPELYSTLDEQPARPGQPYHVVAEVVWRGDPGKYAVVPQVDPADWGTVEVISAQSSVRDGANVLSYTISIVPAVTGTFMTPRISMAYGAPEEFTPPDGVAGESAISANLGPQRLDVAPFPVRVAPDRTGARVCGAITVLAGLAGVVWWTKRRRHTAESKVVPD